MHFISEAQWKSVFSQHPGTAVTVIKEPSTLFTRPDNSTPCLDQESSNWNSSSLEAYQSTGDKRVIKNLHPQADRTPFLLELPGVIQFLMEDACFPCHQGMCRIPLSSGHAPKFLLGLLTYILFCHCKIISKLILKLVMKPFPLYRWTQSLMPEFIYQAKAP